MVDIFTLCLTHVLLGLAAWRIVMRDDLDDDSSDCETVPASRPRGSKITEG